MSWLGIVGIKRDTYLERFTIPQRVRLVGGFAISLRRCKHSTPQHTEPLVAGTINLALSNLVATFQNNNRPDPQHNSDGSTHIHLKYIARSFKKNGPKRESAESDNTPSVIIYLFISLYQRIHYPYYRPIYWCIFLRMLVL